MLKYRVKIKSLKAGDILGKKPSKFNFLIETDNDKVIVVNTFTGAIDILHSDEANHLFTDSEIDYNSNEYLCKRQYLIDDDVSEDILLEKYFESIKNYRRENKSLSCVIILTFDCNLRCTYCWQQNNIHESHSRTITFNQIDKIFDSIEKLLLSLEHAKRDTPIIQLIGGEPLLYKNRDIVAYILKKCKERNWYSQITSNGSQLKEFMDIFEEHGVGEIQVTIDGYSTVHEKRRVGSNFKDTMDSLDSLIQSDKTYIKLRVNTDVENIDSLPYLADEIINRRWYTSSRFYAYISPLRDSSLRETKLIKDRINLLKSFIEKRLNYPQLEIFDVLGWNGYETAKHLENTGRMPYPKGFICDMNMNNFVFTPNGEIHLCLEEAHESKASVGRYSPDFYMDKVLFDNKYDNTPFTSIECKDCNIVPICSGGCQMIDKNKEYKKEFCQSVKECFSLGVENYLETEGLI
ncbi:4Fe-4S cluster-binding domain-containing protein [Tissierella creatinini]|nr:4Fe-4S cluster-binding domain-containing protein [Tissierella creatinini]TJX60376.1 4Fe-4S cluster-binding domain-containing protein [Soehngenia saccharolytica]